jgi:hypothetical protein
MEALAIRRMQNGASRYSLQCCVTLAFSYKLYQLLECLHFQIVGHLLGTNLIYLIYH